MAASDRLWEAAREGRLVVQWSTAADRVVHYPREVSPYAVGDELAWRDADTNGRVLAATVVHRHSHPEFAGQVPFGLVLVELTVGARFIARYEPDESLSPGDDITLEFRGEPPLAFVSRRAAAPGGASSR